jgi:hypothetical protein
MSTLTDDQKFAEGSNLLANWQAGDNDAQKKLRDLFDTVIEGQFDFVFREPAPTDSVCVTTSLHLMTLTILNQLYGLNSSEFYKGDPQRYVRTTLMTQRLLGIRKLTLGWPVYAFGAEALGQFTMYPEQHAPGADPGLPLVDRNNWYELESIDFEEEIPQVVESMLDCFVELTKMEPVAHLPAPYSLAADIFGQENLITALNQDPNFIVEFLDHLTDKIFVPWCERLVKRYPNIWLELSDASGSPFFISPNLCKKIAARPVQRLINDFPWGNRIFVANYRGDMSSKSSVEDSRRRGAGRRRSRERQVETKSKISSDKIDEKSVANEPNNMIDFKLSLCPEFIIKLDADKSPVPIYIEQSILREKPLYLGVGATRIDRNSIADSVAANQELKQQAAVNAQAIKTVSKSLALKGNPRSNLSWPGDVYIEDINAESNLSLVKTIVNEVAIHGVL